MPMRSTFFAALATVLVAFLTVAAMPAAAQDAGPDQTLNITFLTCPDGGDWSAPPPGCTEVVEAPETATVTAAPDWVQPVHELQRNADGSYAVPVPVAGFVGLVNFFSQDFNAFTFDGVDSISRWYGEVSLAQGETRDITVYYWNGPIDLIMPAENTLVVNAFTCDKGVDPAQDASGCESYSRNVPDMYVGTSPLRGLMMEDYLSHEGGAFTYAGLPAYTQAQVVVHQPLAGYGDVLVTGQAEEIEDDAATAFMLRGETRVIDVYFFAPNGTAQTPAPTEVPASGTGTLRLMLLSCPTGVVPHDDPGKCTDTIQDGGAAIVTFPETGERVALARFARDEAGAYLITGIQSSVTIDGIYPVNRDRLATDADQINDQEIVYNVEPGQTRDGRLYYYDEPELRG